MVSVFSCFVSAILSGLLMGVGMLAYTALYSGQYILGALIIGGVFLAIEAADLRYYVTLAGEMCTEKGKLWKKTVRFCVGLVGNLLGVLLVVILLNGRFVEEADAIYVDKCAHFANSIANSLLSGFLGGVLLYGMHRAYRRAEANAVGGLLTVMLAPALMVSGVDCGMFDLFLIFAGKHVQNASLRNFSFITLGNVLGVLAFAGSILLIRELDKLREKDKKEHHHHHHHHHSGT